MTDIFPFLVKADERTVAEIIREAELYLQTQLTASIAADQRAIAFTSLMAATTIGVAAAGGALILSATPNLPIGWTCVAVGIGFLISMFFAILAAMPARFEFPGNIPSQWLTDLSGNIPLQQSMAEQASHYDTMIRLNISTMEKNNFQMAVAVSLAWLSLFVGGVFILVFLILEY